MSLSRLSRSTELFPFLKNLQDNSLASRCLSNDLGWLSYNFIKGNNGHQRHFSYNIRRSMSMSEINSNSLNKQHCRISPFASQYVGRSWSLTALVFAMVGSSYAAVPLYRRFCQATGYGGTVQRRESVEEKIARHSKDGTQATREIIVQFNADVADGMQWKFIPTQREVRVKPGESALAFYTAENRSSTPITGVSTYNVTPMKAGVYFNKIQCFCFEEQRLLPGEQIDMPKYSLVRNNIVLQFPLV
ncbi:hypothetical protein UlMin_045829 [Ulmus minor]